MNQPAPNKTFLQRTREIVATVIARLDQYDINEQAQEGEIAYIKEQIADIILDVKANVLKADYDAFVEFVSQQLSTLQNNKLDISAFTSTIQGLTSSVNALLLSQPKTVEITGTTQAAIAFTAYITNSATIVAVNLPAEGKLGDPIQVIGKGTGGWMVKASAGQIIHGTKDSLVSGNVTSKSRYDSIILTATGVNGANIIDWTLTDVQGNVTIN